MQRAANEVMQSVLFSAVLDAIAALKAGSGAWLGSSRGALG